MCQPNRVAILLTLMIVLILLISRFGSAAELGYSGIGSDSETILVGDIAGNVFTAGPGLTGVAMLVYVKGGFIPCQAAAAVYNTDVGIPLLSSQLLPENNS